MNTKTLSYQLLELIAISGEFPYELSLRLTGKSYRDKIISRLKEDNLIKSHKKEQLKGYRLTINGKRHLLEENEKRFAYYLTGQTETNHPRTDYTRRLRLQYGARILVRLKFADITFFRDEKPAIFTQRGADQKVTLPYPVFYQAREIKELGQETLNLNNSRNYGVLFTEDSIYVLYHSKDGVMNWEYNTELRFKVFLQYQLTNGLLSSIYPSDTPIHAVIMGNRMDIAEQLMTHSSKREKGQFRLDQSYDYFHFIPDNEAGETMVKLFSSPLKNKWLYELMLSDLEPKVKLPFEYDAIKDGKPVLIAYDFDMMRISHYLIGLRMNGLAGQIICFDFQKEVLQRICGDKIDISTIDLDKFIKRFFAKA